MLRRTSALWSFLFASAVLVGLGVFVVLKTRNVVDDTQRVARTHEVLRRLALVDRWAVERTLVDDAHRLPQAPVELALAIRNLQAVVTDNPGQSLRAEQLTTVLTPVVGDDVADARDRARRAQSVIEQMRNEERRLLELRGDVSARSARTVIAASLLAIPLSLGVLWLSFALMRREARERGVAERQARAANDELQRTTEEQGLLSRRMTSLNRYSGLLQSAVEPSELIELTHMTFADLLPKLAAVVYLVRASQDHAEVATTWGDVGVEYDPMPLPESCWALRRGRVHQVADLAQGPRCQHVLRVDTARSCLCVPLAAQGEQLGWIQLTSATPIDEREADLAVAAVEQLALALANIRLKERLRYQAIRDPLTGLFNRRYLEESLVRDLKRTHRRGLPLSVLMIDVDHFKAFNDRHGHQGGDAVLAALGTLLKSKCRSEDIACRFGGEEFTLVLPEMDLAAAEQRAEEVRAAVATMEAKHLGAALPPVTVSIGIAGSPVHGDDPGEIVRLGDLALYAAKRAGRDRVVTAPAPDTMGTSGPLFTPRA